VRRVIPVARTTRFATGRISVLSIEDCGREFLVRLAMAADALPSARDFASFGFRGSDDRGNLSQGVVASAFPIAGGFDIAVLFEPGLESGATKLELSVQRPARDWHLVVPLAADGESDVRRSPVDSRLGSGATSALKLARAIAAENGLPLGYEHLLVGTVHFAMQTSASRTLSALALTPERVQSAVRTVTVRSGPLPPLSVAPILTAAAGEADRHGAWQIGPEHLLLAILERGELAVDRVLGCAGLTTALVYGLLDANLEPRSELRRVVLIARTGSGERHALMLLSLEDYGGRVILHGHWRRVGSRLVMHCGTSLSALATTAAVPTRLPAWTRSPLRYRRVACCRCAGFRRSGS
jgi:hypothetical protein